MELLELKTENELVAFNKNEFLQSWTWGEIQKKAGLEIRRYGLREINKIGQVKNLAAITLIKLDLGSAYFYWSAPRGPIFNLSILEGKEAEERTSEILSFLFTEIKKIDGRALFLRIEPSLRKLDNLKIIYKKTLDLQPAQTLVLDLKKDEEQLLKEMQPKTRYNLRLAQKKGVLIREGDINDLSEFWRLMTLTGERDAFRLHSFDHYENLLKSGQGKIKLFLAVFNKQNIAAGLFSFYGETVTYMHGASDNEFRNVMAPYLLQWSLALQAKKEGYKYYDFFGIDEKKWPGVTRFKKGFGGKEISYAGTYDLIFRPYFYSIYNILRKIRRAIC